MRTPRAYRILERAFRAGKQRNGMHLVQYTVLPDHVHLIVEVENRTQLSRGMQGLNIRLAKALNRHWRRRGKVLADRYFAVVVKSTRQAMKVLKYVLNNARKHGLRMASYEADPFSSGDVFYGWERLPEEFGETSVGLVAKARTWLLRIGWLRHGRISLLATPRAA